MFEVNLSVIRLSFLCLIPLQCSMVVITMLDVYCRVL